MSVYAKKASRRKLKTLRWQDKSKSAVRTLAFTEDSRLNTKTSKIQCSSCGEVVKKTLSTRTHACKCGCVMDRDENAARIILSRGLSTVGHTGTFALDASNAWGDETSTLVGENLLEQVMS